MKLTILVDNNTLIDKYYIGEPAVSYLIQDGAKQILFDVGYSNAFIVNAQKMDIDLLQSDFVVLSHGHLDHTWGLEHLMLLHAEATIEKLPAKRPMLIAHPDVFQKKCIHGINEFGCKVSELELRKQLASTYQRALFGLPISSSS